MLTIYWNLICFDLLFRIRTKKRKVKIVNNFRALEVILNIFLLLFCIQFYYIIFCPKGNERRFLKQLFFRNILAGGLAVENSPWVSQLTQSFAQDISYAVPCAKIKTPKCLFLPHLIKTSTKNTELVNLICKTKAWCFLHWNRRTGYWERIQDDWKAIKEWNYLTGWCAGRRFHACCGW